MIFTIGCVLILIANISEMLDCDERFVAFVGVGGFSFVTASLLTLAWRYLP